MQSWVAERRHFAAYACPYPHGGITTDQNFPPHRHYTRAMQIEHELGSARHPLDPLSRAIAAHGLLLA